MSVVMNCEAPGHLYSFSTEPVAKLNQMGQWTCCLKTFGGLHHQKVTNLPMLKKGGGGGGGGGCTQQFRPFYRIPVHIGEVIAEQLGNQLNLHPSTVPKTWRPLIFFPQWTWHKKIGSPIRIPKISKSSVFDFI